MKSLFFITRRYVMAAFFVLFSILFLDLAAYAAIFGVYAARHGNRESIQNIAAQIVMDDGKPGMTQDGLDLIDRDYSWAMLLDQNGNAIWQYRLPDEIPTSYTAPEVASFSRWYLNDYPVYVWRHEENLLVLARPRYSYWKLNYDRPMDIINRLPDYLLLVLLSNLLLILLFALLAGKNLYRSLLPILAAIHDLAGQKEVSLPEQGIFSDLTASLNKTSALLAEQNRQLSQRDLARATWIRGVSHDIRTPLSLVMGYARELEELEALPEQARTSARIIKEQSLCIRQLIEDLNLTSRLEYRSCPLRITTVYPASLLRQTAADFFNQGVEEHWDIQIRCSPAFSAVRLDVDASLITRVFRNLIGNSIRHNPEGCTITIVASITDDGQECSILFMDDGQGIPRRVIQLLETGTAQPDPGENQPHIMGLKIVCQIVKVHNGSVKFFTDTEQGCRICVTLPVSP